MFQLNPRLQLILSAIALVVVLGGLLLIDAPPVEIAVTDAP